MISEVVRRGSQRSKPGPPQYVDVVSSPSLSLPLPLPCPVLLPTHSPPADLDHVAALGPDGGRHQPERHHAQLLMCWVGGRVVSRSFVYLGGEEGWFAGHSFV